MFSSGLMGVFALLGSNGTITPIAAVSGIIASIAGGIGICLDWKDRFRKSK